MRGAVYSVLVVDDEDEIRRILRDVLEPEGYSVFEAAGGQDALTRIRTDRPDVVILDLGLPDQRGLEVLRELRAESSVPVIVLSGQVDETDRVLGLELGADDYVTKPFSPREVAIRVRNVLRRFTPGSADVLRFDDFTIDLRAREVVCGGLVIDLTSREFDLISFLASEPRRVFSPDQLLRQVWQTEPGWQSPTTVSEHVYRIRQKLELDPHQPRRLVTVRGAGYRFDP
jgi:DNA-binding response OmpR family regulator